MDEQLHRFVKLKEPLEELGRRYPPDAANPEETLSVAPHHGSDQSRRIDVARDRHG